MVEDSDNSATAGAEASASTNLEFSPQAFERFQKIVKRYPASRSALLPTLDLAQREFGGWLSLDTLRYVSDLLELSLEEVRGTASFYTMFHLNPVGKNVIWVCKTLSCHVRGAEDILKHLSERLGIEIGGTTEDGQFSLFTAECLGSCGTAPMMQVNDDYYEDLTIEQVDEIIDRLRNGAGSEQ